MLNAANYPTRSYQIGERSPDDVAEALHNIFNAWHALSYARADAD
jgi:hypothetical protein